MSMLHNITRAGLAAAGLCLLLPAASSAQMREHSSGGIPSRLQEQWLEQHPGMDADGDGAITRDEARAYFEAHPELRPQRGRDMRGREEGDRGMRGREDDRGRMRGMDDRRRMGETLLRDYPEADADQDGRLSYEEVRQFFEAHPELLLERRPELDTDGDGKLSPEERAAARDRFRGGSGAGLLERFPEADTDGDGQLSEDEMRALRERFRGRFGPDAGRGERFGRGGPGIDPWVAYVEQFCRRHNLDESQRATAHAILRECMAKRDAARGPLAAPAAESAVEPAAAPDAPGDAQAPSAEPRPRRQRDRDPQRERDGEATHEPDRDQRRERGRDRLGAGGPLFEELRMRLDEILTAEQRQAATTRPSE
ncbi:MAG: hypothetical protein JXA69_15735 [Phycisphaerae bacterium]|nr:hypothetical protein [Phycisphaerae bacterium]